MGIISQGILGGFSGKVGNVVGATWKGINYIRIMPASVANPRTPGQVNQRNKFSATVRFLSASLSYIREGFKFYANKQSAYNAAMSYVLENAITGTAPDFNVDYANALVSRGNLTGPLGASAAAAVGAVNFTWTDNSTAGNAQADDQAMLLAYNTDQQEAAVLLSGAATRSAASESLSLPTNFTTGETLEVYLAFRRADGSAVSNSVYLGSQTVV